MIKVCLVSLGCPKNLVDSETALGEILQAGYEIEADQSKADVILVNTCGFVESARAESIEAILDAIEQKRAGRCKAVVVIGCLSQRFAHELAGQIEEVDAYLGVAHSGRVAQAIEKALSGKGGIEIDAVPASWVEPSLRIQSTPPWTAYIKISDGCDNRCAYCAIPDIRGPYRSRPEPLILDEARKLADNGVKELILVGQDSTQYGTDLDNQSSLPKLVEKLSAIEPLKWIRLMYCYPSKVTDELIYAMASSDKVVKYLDIPFQHGDDNILKAMNRRGTSADYLRVIDKLREAMPEIALRSSFIVGFPGETEEAFGNLKAFVEKIQFDRVGIFTYSREDNTPAAGFKGKVKKKTAIARWHELMQLQQSISLNKNKEFVGKNLEVLVEGRDSEGLFGRSYRDAPDIDGVVYLADGAEMPGEFVDVKISNAREYDLLAN